MDRRGGRRSLWIVALVVSWFLTAPLDAGPVELSQVQKVTDAFLKAKAVPPGAGAKPGAISAQGFAVGAQLTPGGLREIRSDEGTLLAYVADLEPSGFIALSADRDIAPVVAYSFQSSFPRGSDKKNPLYCVVREDLRRRVRALAEHPELKTPAAGRLWDLYVAGQISRAGDASFQQWPPVGSTSTGGWLQTAWEQGAPYNQFCPRDTVNGGRSYVGCVATALAQVLNYHRQCHATFGPNDAYTMYSGMQMDADSTRCSFPSFAELNRCMAKIQSKYRDEVDLNDVEVAALSFAGGVATHMDYSSEGSGAGSFDIQRALRDKFGFYAADMFGALSAESYLVLQENMINRLPAVLTMTTADGFIGHVVVCDGYNTDGEYHLNFGWGADVPQRITAVWYHLPSELYPLDMVVTESLLNVQPQPPALTTGPGSLNFYGAPGQESDPQLLRLRTNGEGVSVDSVSSPAGFVLSNNSAFSDQLGAFLIPPAQEAVIQIKFRPERVGGYYGTLAIHYNDGNVRYVILRGWSFDTGTAVAAGEVSGTWSQDKSPYFVGGDIRVPESGSLVIEPGVKVFFTGPYSLTVGKRAKLTAQGTAVAPIELTAWNREVGWAGLRFLNSGSDDVLSYCSLSWARKAAGIIPPEPNDATDVPEEDTYGGAIYCSNSDPTIDNCRLTNNVGDGGGALYCVDSFPLVSNTLIANNASAGGMPRCGGVCACNLGAPELRNCTIVNNSPGGIFVASWDGMVVTNTIVWGNEMYQIETDQSAPEVTFCDVEGGYAGAGNWSADPAFLSPSAGVGIEYDGAAANWVPQSSSPCLNAGTGVGDLPETDLAGAARWASDVLDLGAYENQADLPLVTLSPSGIADAGFIQLNTSSTLRLEVANTGKQDFTIQSLSISEGTRAFSLLTSIANRVLAPGESLPVEITFTPTREVVYRGKLDVRSTASNGARVQVVLKGVGISGTVVPAGAVSGTWTKASSPYVVTGDIRIGRSKTLTIEPGVTVKFAGHFGMTVGYRGTLRAIGTEQERIVFTAVDRTEGWFGLRLINSGSDDTLRFCTLEYARKPRTGGGGVASLFGGAILCYGSFEDEPGFPLGSSPTIASCLLAHNYAFMGGAIACWERCDAAITKNTILDNAADYYGAGIALADSAGTIANNVIARNSAWLGGGVALLGSSPSIRNNTMVSNRPSALHVDSLLLDDFGDPEPVPITNNIFWKNEIYVFEDLAPGDVKIRFNDLPGGWPGEGNIGQDPQFADPDADDYRLKSAAGRWDPLGKIWVTDAVTSPCIDAGDPASSLGQEPAPNGQRIDMGAYGGTDQASKSPGS